MSRIVSGSRILFASAGILFLLIQMKLFTTQSQYAGQLSVASKGENDCITRLRSLIDEINTQQGKIASLEDDRKQLESKNEELSTLLRRIDRKETLLRISQQQLNGGVVAAVVVMACNRPDYLEKTLNSILKYHRPVARKFSLFISQDGSDRKVEAMAKNFSQFTFLQHLEFETPKGYRPGEIIAYYKIASHYKWALNQLFKEKKFRRVIILEDDMEIALDFFDYFEATAVLMDNDRSIMAVSSWNDNGQKQFVQDPEKLYRSDFFPGLGWMLNKDIWEELEPKWPNAYWDDWLRLKENRQGRQFILPEVCRNYNFGEHGTSMGQFFKTFLESVKLNDIQVDWKSADLSYLSEPTYSKEFGAALKRAWPISRESAVMEARKADGDVRIEYNSQQTFEFVASQFGIFQEWKDGVPRTAFKGVVVFRWEGAKRVFLHSSQSFSELGIKF